MKNLIIAALVGIIAVGGALGALAATRTVETTANVEVTVWQRVSDGALYLSTRPEGGSWTTHQTPLDMSARSRSGNFRQGSAITVGVPVSVEVEIPDVTEPAEEATPAVTPTPASSESRFGQMYGEGQSCLTTTGCGMGYFKLPYNTPLIVGVDIAPGKWNSDYETAGEDSCWALRLDATVKQHSRYTEETFSQRYEWASGTDSGFMPVFSLYEEQPSGRYEWHSSVIERRYTDYVYDPREFTITVLTSDYALLINSECH